MGATVTANIDASEIVNQIRQMSSDVAFVRGEIVVILAGFGLVSGIVAIVIFFWGRRQKKDFSEEMTKVRNEVRLDFENLRPSIFQEIDKKLREAFDQSDQKHNDRDKLFKEHIEAVGIKTKELQDAIEQESTKSQSQIFRALYYLFKDQPQISFLWGVRHIEAEIRLRNTQYDSEYYSEVVSDLVAKLENLTFANFEFEFEKEMRQLISLDFKPLGVEEKVKELREKFEKRMKR